MPRQKKRYSVKIAKDWYACTKANEVKDGFLEYSLKDGTTGITKNWRRDDDDGPQALKDLLTF